MESETVYFNYISLSYLFIKTFGTQLKMKFLPEFHRKDTESAQSTK